jgi:hypothetical protein
MLTTRENAQYSDYIQIRSPVYISHSAGRYAVKRFRKAQCPIIERLTNSLMMNGRNNGKKLMAVRIVAHAFEIVRDYVIVFSPIYLIPFFFHHFIFSLFSCPFLPNHGRIIEPKLSIRLDFFFWKFLFYSPLESDKNLKASPSFFLQM